MHKVVIVRSTDRDQLRGQITGKKTIRTSAYPSKKMKRARFMEAAAEILRVPQEEVEVDKVENGAAPPRRGAPGRRLAQGASRFHDPPLRRQLLGRGREARVA
ncbi:hypothetical protein AB5I41_24925 [Sphingomonas sp. MMS24-JH45]